MGKLNMSVGVEAFGVNKQSGSIEVATACNAKGGSGRMDFESETFIVTEPICFEPGLAKREGSDSRFTEGVSPTLRREMGDNQPAIAYALAGNIIGRKPENGGHHIGYDESGTCYTLTKTDLHAVCYRTNAAGQVNDQGEIAAALNTFTDPNAQFLLETKAFVQNTRCEARYTVRRLTPTECSRLQGFPDKYLDIRFRNKPAADGNKYKALGNSFAVPVVRWIGRRIQAALML